MKLKFDTDKNMATVGIMRSKGLFLLRFIDISFIHKFDNIVYCKFKFNHYKPDHIIELRIYRLQVTYFGL